jgi:hypothetical protein
MRSVADQHGLHLALPASVRGGRALVLAAQDLASKTGQAFETAKGEAVSMKRCARLSALEARHREVEHGFGTKREARACTKRGRGR